MTEAPERVSVSKLPWPDVLQLPRSLRDSWTHHRLTRESARQFRFYTRWKRGPADGVVGPLMLSYTQFTPHRLADAPSVWRAADRLADQLVQLDGAVGVMSYLQPGYRRFGSLSVWADEAGLDAFLKLPYHLEIMRTYRPRGLPLRSAKWWSDSLQLGTAMADGQRLLDAHDGRRVTVPRP